MKRVLTILSIVFLCASCKNSVAQEEVTCVAKAPAEVGVNQQFQYTVTTNSKGTVLETDFGKFELVGGPSTSTSTSFTVQGGNTEHKTTYSYTYFLTINKEGTFNIPGVSMSIDGKVVQSNPVTVKVLKAVKNQNDNSDSQGFFNFQWPDMDSFFGSTPFGDRRDGHDDEKIDYKDNLTKDDMFIKASIPQSEAYKGEPVVVTYKLYIKKDIRNYEIARANFAQSDAVAIEPLELNYRDEETETIKGETYHVYTVKQTAVYPQKTGKVTIPKLDMVMRIGIPAVVNNSFWGRIQTIRPKDFQLTSNELHLKVKPLPNAHDDSKVDIIGHFEISSSISNTEVYAERPFTITITVSGNGNLHNIKKDDISLEIPSGWDQMYPKVSQRTSAKGNLVSGSKSFKITIIPHTTGEFFIPASKFTYYDDEAMGYKTVTTQDFRITVKEGAAPSNSKEKSPLDNAKTYKI